MQAGDYVLQDREALLFDCSYASRKKRAIACRNHSIRQYFQPKKMDTKKRCPAHSGDRKQVLGTCIHHVNYSQIPVKPLGRVQDTRASK